MKKLSIERTRQVLAEDLKKYVQIILREYSGCIS